MCRDRCNPLAPRAALVAPALDLGGQWLVVSGDSFPPSLGCATTFPGLWVRDNGLFFFSGPVYAL
eukprot:5089860-Heterocapsa_arctica.AAC.1